MNLRQFLPLIVVIICASEARAQTGAASPEAPARTMASLLAEGYEMQDVRVFKDKIWMRKPGGEGLAFICDRGRIGSAAFDAYRKKEYDQVQCSASP